MVSDKELKYLEVAEFFANKFSKDNSTKVGAVAIDPESFDILSTGYNWFPRKVKETPERMERPLKYIYIEHAERNLIDNAAREGKKLKGSTLLCSMFPCHDCARGIIQAGIKKLITRQPDNVRWLESSGYALEMLTEAGVEIEYV